ncbi:MAG: 3-dehydroquinate synthase [Pseudomonadota bacterium]
MPNPLTVRVPLGNRSYDIHIGGGLLSDAAMHIGPHLSRNRVFVLTDQHLADLHLNTLSTAMERAGFAVQSRALSPGEQTKSWDILGDTLGWLLEAGAGRDDLLIALGGGVIGDLAGLAASLMKRGMKFVQVPTTLLAQVDSSVGGKTAVNSDKGKNLIGQFYQPKLVLADTDVLATLPDRERLAGYAEIVKYALIDRPDFFDWLEENGSKVLALETDAVAHAVAISCQAKADIVAQDEREGGVRALLNLGHTFGHALEAANGYAPSLLHGEAVGTGMALAFRYSERLGLCSSADADRAVSALNRAGFKTAYTTLEGGPYRPDELVAHMRQDKKARNGRVPLILARGIGKAFIHPDSDLGDVQRFLEAETTPA